MVDFLLSFLVKNMVDFFCDWCDERVGVPVFRSEHVVHLFEEKSEGI